MPSLVLSYLLARMQKIKSENELLRPNTIFSNTIIMLSSTPSKKAQNNFSMSLLCCHYLFMKTMGHISVETGGEQRCDETGYLKLKNKEGYLARMITEDTGRGSANCPWLIEASPGQVINITLIDFRFVASLINIIGVPF